MSPSRIQDTKARHSLAEVAARTGLDVPVRAGALVTVRCPMPSHGHPDRTPSLRLDLRSQQWWCFACSPTDTDGTPKAGDVIDWVSHTEGVDWRAAIEILDSGRSLTNMWAAPAAAGHSVQQVRPDRHIGRGDPDTPDLHRTPAERVQHALESAWIFYTSGQLHRQGARYLSTRGIDVEWLERHNRRFEAGHTPAEPTGLIDWMRARGFDDHVLVDAGLAYRRPDDGYMSDFYRHRIMIPVRDRHHNLAGFIGRNVGDTRWPKYKNPPRTVRYDKSANLYQPLPAPEQPRGKVIVVEGTLDAMAIAVAAIRSGRSDWYCPITQSGRELSPRQLRYVLSIHSEPPIIAMDGDEPGRSSNERVAAGAAALGRQVVLAPLPDGEDPASWLDRRGPAGLAVFTRGPTPGSSQRDESASRHRDTVSDREAAIRLARRVLSQQPRPGIPAPNATPLVADLGRLPSI